MNILFIDLGSHEKMLALVGETRTIASVRVDDHTEEGRLLPILHDLLKKHGMTEADLTHIVAVLGPGGFMSLRVGVSLANALGYMLRIPAAGIHVSDVWRERVSARDCVWIHSTKREQVFIRGFGKFAKKWPETILVQSDILAKLSKGTPYVGDLIAEHETLLKHCSRAAAATTETILPALLAPLTYSAGVTLLPWYGRDG